jgi:hypothetical protein
MYRLSELWQAADPGSDERTEYEAEFDALKEQLKDTRDDTEYEGNALFSTAGDTTFATIDMSVPGISQTLTMGYETTDVMTDSEIDDDTDITTGAGLDVLLTKATTVLTKAEGFEDRVTMNINVVDSIIQSKEAAKSVLTDIDDAVELNKAIDLFIRQEALVAMMAQANVSRSGLSRFYTSGQ